MKKYKYRGKLEFYFEQGEICFPMLQDFRGIDKQGYYSWDWAYVFDKKSPCEITIFNEKQEIIFKGTWTFDRQNTAANNYYYSPKEIDPKKWREYTIKGYEAEVETNHPVDAEKNMFKPLSSEAFKLYFFNEENKSWEQKTEGTLYELQEGVGVCVRQKVAVGYREFVTNPVQNFRVFKNNNQLKIDFITDKKERYYLISG